MTDYDPKTGQAIAITAMVQRITAPNPSPMTYHGTNTYIIGSQQGDIAVLDPGPDHNDHLQTILAATDGPDRISHIFVTHAHLDHSPLARRLSERTNAPIYAFGTAKAGQSATMQALERAGYDGGGEGIDHSFVPGIYLNDQDLITANGWTIRAHHTPGHMANHLCFQLEDMLFSGDHIMGWATSMVSPPDGDLTQFLASCAKLRTTRWSMMLPGHGDVVHAPNDRIDELVTHRHAREAQIIAALETAPATAWELACQIYHDVDSRLLPAASRNVLSHCISLSERGLISYDNPLNADSIFRIF